MARHSYRCDICGWTEKLRCSLETKVICPSCSIPATRQLPTLNGPSNITEVVDKYTGVAWRQNQQEEVKQRREEYYWSVEVPRLVNSGTYSLETMLENEWIWIDDNGHIQTYNKAPASR